MTTKTVTTSAQGIVRDVERQIDEHKVRLDAVERWIAGEFGELTEARRYAFEVQAETLRTVIQQYEGLVRDWTR